jgi:hypothetical protein
MIDIDKFKVGDKVKIIKISWNKPELVGKIGEITFIDDKEKTYSIYFKEWNSGHEATNDFYLKYGRRSSWCFYSPDLNYGDYFVKVSKVGQLEFDF